MIRGTTPYFSFNLPFSYESIEVGYITFSQNDKVVLDRKDDTWVVQDRTATIHLTQSETLMFNHNAPVEIQLAVRRTDGEVFRSDIGKTSARRILKNEEI